MGKYWRNMEEFVGKEKSHDGDISMEFQYAFTRRDFLKLSAYGISAAALMQACRSRPLKNVLPYQPDSFNSESGIIKWYASVCAACTARCPVLVKTYDNRPVKIEGNPISSRTGGGLCAFGQAALFGLYSNQRQDGPLRKGKEISWSLADTLIIKELEILSADDKSILLLSSTINSPSTLAVVDNFKKKFPASQLVFEDFPGFASIFRANKLSFGKEVIPRYLFAKAETIVSFNCDFCGTWLSPVEYAWQYKSQRIPDYTDSCRLHVQFESIPSITGLNADYRISLNPREELPTLIALYNMIAKALNKSRIKHNPSSRHRDILEKISENLLTNKGKSIVLSGTDNLPVQLVVNGINDLLGNLGRTIDFENPAFYFSDNAVDKPKFYSQLLEEHKEGAVIFLDDLSILAAERNPLLQKIIKNAPLTISLATFLQKNLKNSFDYHCPDHHFLECWRDYEALRNQFCLSQPVVSPLFNTRQMEDTLLRWSGIEISFFEFLRNHWQERIINETEQFETAWKEALKNGIYNLPFNPLLKGKPVISEDISRAIQNTAITESEFATELIFFHITSQKNIHFYSNKWLEELADPVTGVCYQPWLSVSPSLAESEHLKEGEIIELQFRDGKNLPLPVKINPGQAGHCVGIPLGIWQDGSDTLSLISEIFTGIRKTGDKSRLPGVTAGIAALHEKDIPVLSFSALSLKKNENAEPGELFKKKYPLHHWGMVIDLNACTGCQACVVSCMAENNIPLVGQEQLLKGRNMNWLRVDKFYSGSPEHPEVFFLPLPCQQCTNAPCEPVCPVSATSGSSEGLNMQNYNRCIGSRFCASNCPYVVRKFNFYQYSDDKNLNPHFNDKTGRLILNPDVSTREKGVIEKCTFCIQRIQEVKNKAKNNGKAILDGDIQTACSQSCPTKAIIFGDLNDKSSRISRMIENKRAFRLMEQQGTMPSVFYLAKVKNDLLDDSKNISGE